MKTIKNQIFLLIFLSFYVCSQAQDGTYYAKRAFVLAYRIPEKSITIDVDGIEEYSDAYQQIQITEATQLLDKKQKPLHWVMLRAGVELEVKGEYYGKEIRATKLTVLQSLTKDGKADGILEWADDKSAVIDGQKVTLLPDAELKGTEAWKGRSFKTFRIIDLGAFADVVGERRADGILYVKSGKVSPNQMSKGDIETHQALTKGLNIQTNLNGGKVQIGQETFKLSENRNLQAYINRIGNLLIPAYIKNLPEGHPSKVLYRFYVIEDDTFNAFAYPDGSVFVHTGLLKIIENEAQLAAILGHEIAHVTHEHGRKQLMANNKINLLGDVAGDLQNNGVPKNKEGVFSRAKTVLEGKSKQQVTNSDKNIEVSVKGDIDINTLEIAKDIFKNKIMSQPMENQADRIGLFYMVQAGYDPREATKVWSKLVQINGQPDIISKMKGLVENIYTSHPQAKNRLRYLNREIAMNYHQMDFSKSKIGVDEYQAVMNK